MAKPRKHECEENLVQAKLGATIYCREDPALVKSDAFPTCEYCGTTAQSFPWSCPDCNRDWDEHAHPLCIDCNSPLYESDYEAPGECRGECFVSRVSA